MKFVDVYGATIEQQIIDPKQNFQRHWNICKSQLSRLFPSYQALTPRSNPCQPLSVTFTNLSAHTAPFSLCSTISLSPTTYTLYVQTSILRNSVPITVGSRSHRLMLMHFLCRLNSPQRNCGFYKVHPTTGLLTFTLCYLITEGQFLALIVKAREMIAWVRWVVKEAECAMKREMGKLLYIAGELPQVVKPMKNPTYTFLEKALSMAEAKFDFMDKDRSEKISQQDIQKALKYFPATPSQISPMLNPYLKAHSLQPVNLASQSPKSFLQFMIGKDYLHVPQVYFSSPLEKNTIFSEIHILSTNPWVVIGQGGFSNIEQGEAVYVYINRGEDPETIKLTKDRWIKKELVRKVQKNGNGRKKIEHQKMILRTIQDKKCPFIMKFYWTKQPEYQDMLFMDSCKHRSIDSLLKSQETFLSPLNRLFLVYSAAQALRFIHKHSIIHLDIKPANILVGRNFLLRLTDFGESYHPQLCNSNYHPGFTVPYSPPDIFRTEIAFNSNIDLYGFGMTMFQIICDRTPKNILRCAALTKERFEKAIKIALPETSVWSCQDSMRVLQRLGLKCVGEDPAKRPLVQWVVILLRGIVELVQRVD